MKRTFLGTILALAFTALPATADDTEEAVSDAQLTLDDLRTFTDAFHQVRLNFIEEVDDRTLLHAAIRGMLSELDPHSAFLEPDELQQLNDDSKGRYVGIGVEVSVTDDFIRVLQVREGSAAHLAGIVDGDVIIAVDGVDVRTVLPRQAIDRLRGKPGTGVTVTVRHLNGEVSTLELVRDYVEVTSVFSRPVDGDYGYFQITHFTRKTADELLEQVEYMQARRETPLLGIVIDLRGNPGGVLKSAVTIADGFLDDGLIVSTRGRSPDQYEYLASPGQWFVDIPVVVLVDGRSASASEVLAGALQDHHRALVVGERTYGKGSIQTVLNLRNGSGIRLTTSVYYTPSGRSIRAEGIRPDVEVPPATTQDESRQTAVDSAPGQEAARGIEATQAEWPSDVSPEDDLAMHRALMLLKDPGRRAPPTDR